MDTPSRRAVLIAGAGLASGLAGCASLAERVEQSSADGTTPVPAQTTRRTTAPPETTRRKTTTRHQSGVNDGPEDATETTIGDGLGRIDIGSPAVSFDDAPRVKSPGDYTYARLGRDDAPVTATVYGNWKCPFTREFVLSHMPNLVEEFVVPGAVAIEFRALAYADDDPFLGPDAPRAARAGLAVWNVDPERYWRYFALVFTNQPQERYAWATTDRLVRFTGAADVGSTNAVRSAVTDGAYADPVHATTRAAADRSVSAVPRVVVGDTVTAPTLDVEKTRRQLRNAIERNGGSTRSGGSTRNGTARRNGSS